MEQWIGSVDLDEMKDLNLAEILKSRKYQHLPPIQPHEEPEEPVAMFKRCAAAVCATFVQNTFLRYIRVELYL